MAPNYLRRNRAFLDRQRMIIPNQGTIDLSKMPSPKLIRTLNKNNLEDSTKLLMLTLRQGVAARSTIFLDHFHTF